MLDPYVIIGRTTAEYNRRDLWKHAPHVELTILDIATNYCQIIGTGKLPQIAADCGTGGKRWKAAVELSELT